MPIILLEAKVGQTDALVFDGIQLVENLSTEMVRRNYWNEEAKKAQFISRKIVFLEPIVTYQFGH